VYPSRGEAKAVACATLVAFKKDDKAFFIYGFAKNRRANISDREKKALKRLAKELFSYTNHGLEKAVKAGELIEVV
jgi:hypothetical protein